MPISDMQLVEHYREIEATRMRGLPIVNSRLEVEAVGFRAVGDDQVGILITPWFMNLVVLPGDDSLDEIAQGVEVEWAFPAGDYSLMSCRDDELGAYLTAILFRTVADFPDQDTARAIATTILESIFSAPEEVAQQAPSFSRRELFSRLGTG